MTDKTSNRETEDPVRRNVPPDRASTKASARPSALAKSASGSDRDASKGSDKIVWSDAAEGTTKPRNGMSIAAVIVGVLSLVGLLMFGLLDVVLIIAAIVLGALSLLRIKRGLGGRKSFGIAGIALGLIAAILFGVLVYTTSRRIDNCGHKLGRDLHGLSTKDLKNALNLCDKK